MRAPELLGLPQMPFPPSIDQSIVERMMGRILNLEQLVRRLNAQQRFDNDYLAIDNTRLTAPAATITFADILGDYVGLKIVAFVRTDRAAVSDTMAVNFNNDTGNNYEYLISSVVHSGALGTTEGIAASAWQIGEVAGANAVAAVFSPVEIIIPSYAIPVLAKGGTATSGNRRANSTGNIVKSEGVGFWRNTTDAITEIDLTPVGGTNFVAGSQFYLYGLRAEI